MEQALNQIAVESLLDNKTLKVKKQKELKSTDITL